MKIVKSPYLLIMKDIFNKEKNIIRNLLTDIDYDLNEYSKILSDFLVSIEYEDAVKLYGKVIIDTLLANKLLIYENRKWNYINIESVEIEICRHCNWRCIYCPVSISPKAPEVMSMPIFCEIIDKIERNGNVKNVTFNSFNEPSIDPFLKERLQYLEGKNIKLRLHTNGSNLNEDILDYLKKSNILSKLFFNLPSVDMEEFNRMTGSNQLKRVISNIEYSIRINLPVQLSIQGNRNDLKKNLEGIRRLFKGKIDDIKEWGTFDRAGLLKNEYFQNIEILDSLVGGCHSVLRWLNIATNGDCFLCSNDYNQDYIFGNIRDGEINDICQNEKAVNFRRMIYGDLVASNDFICRHCITMKRAKLLSRFNL